MQIQISPSSGAPIYLQIVNQVKYLVASGRFPPGAAACCEAVRNRRIARRLSKICMPAFHKRRPGGIGAILRELDRTLVPALAVWGCERDSET